MIKRLHDMVIGEPTGDMSTVERVLLLECALWIASCFITGGLLAGFIVAIVELLR